MPDGDIFQRSLAGSGKGWVRIFRSLNVDPQRTDLGPAILKAVRCNLDQLPRSYLLESFGLLGNAFRNDGLPKLGQNVMNGDSFTELDSRLRTLEFGKAFGTAQIINESIKATFSVERLNTGVSGDQIVATFCSIFGNKFLDSRFSKIRPTLQEARERTTQEQNVWEESVKNQSTEGLHKMIERYLAGGGVRFRVPVIRRRPAASVRDLLLRPVRILEP